MGDHKKSVRKFRLAAGQRLEAALFLLRDSAHYRDAIYLAGYSIECAVKALILQRTPKNSFAEMFDALTHGKKAHDFEYLKGILVRAPINLTIPGDVTEQLMVANYWTTSIRYEVALVEYDEAKEFLDAAQFLYQWAERNLS